MIDLKFCLFWSGGKLSYLRYLTFLSLRRFHPDSIIELYISEGFKSDGFKWSNEKQDFQNKEFKQTVELKDLESIGIDIKEYDKYQNMAPNFQSDMFRWDWLCNNSGFYLDTDQIILKSFDGLDRDYNLIYSGYKANSCGYYTPVGVIGSNHSEFAKWMVQLLPQLFNENNYNSIGPFGFRSVLQCYNGREKMFNTPSNYFYPIPESYMVGDIYEGKLNLEDCSKNGYACHWYGGHHLSQEFNKNYTEEFAKSSSDSISVFLREKAII
ncbi:MAG: glycosyltransferase [Synergistaceae bacterium]